ncbi:type II toxin-antitoxin system HicB family antitoxin [Maricaulis salignorans]|uniref:type II toxin-antitoxin system HicB family antitoxin n=1 Tax=Maricaulis salignorans TaxID=144026 RepID=UPI003A8C9855
MSEQFVAFVHEGDAGNYGVSFADAPGVVAVGDSVEGALEASRKALRSNFNAMVDEGFDVPVARPIEVVINDPAYAEDRADALLVTVVSPAPKVGKSIRINISVDEFMLERIDLAAERSGLTRSKFLVEGALKYA